MNIRTLKELQNLRQTAKEQLSVFPFVTNMGIDKAEDGLFYINIDVDSTVSQTDLAKLPENIDSVKLHIRRIDSIHIEA